MCEFPKLGEALWLSCQLALPLWVQRLFGASVKCKECPLVAPRAVEFEHFMGVLLVSRAGELGDMGAQGSNFANGETPTQAI